MPTVRRENTNQPYMGGKMRRVLLTAIIGAMVIASSATATKKSSFTVAGTALPGATEQLVVVPITISFDADLTALDIPLKYSAGVTLTEVKLGEMLRGFDFSIANIDAANSRVIIGAINAVYGAKPSLVAGEGVVAELVFRVDDPAVTTLTIEKVRLEKPTHDLFFVYNENKDGKPQVMVTTPEFAPIEVALSDVAAGPTVPLSFEIGQNYPNPFNPTTKFDYSVAKAGMVTLEVFNVLGQKVRTLVNENQAPSTYQIEWNGVDDNGKNVASGVYFYKINADGGRFNVTRKMMMLK